MKKPKIKKRVFKRALKKRKVNMVFDKLRDTAPLQLAQWDKEMVDFYTRKDFFNRLKMPITEAKREGISGDPFSMVGNEETPHRSYPTIANFHGGINVKEPMTRGELGKAPAHYSNGKFTPWEIVDDWKLEYYCGNALKYVCRHKHKGTPVQDIQKAIDCLIKYKTNLEKETK